MNSPAALDEQRHTLRVLAAARIGLAAVILARTTPILSPLHLARLQGTWPLLGWPEDRWTLTFGPALPPTAVAILCIVRTLGALALLTGIATPIAGWLCGLAGLLVVSQDVFAWNNTLRLLYLGAIVLATADTGCTVAIVPSPPRAPASSRMLVQLFVVSIYAWAALAKLNADWLGGVTLDLFHRSRLLTGPIAEIALLTAARRHFVAWTMLVIETVLGPLLMLRRTRAVGLGLAIAMHVGLDVVAKPDVFGFAMLALLVVFIEPRSRGPGTARSRGVVIGAGAGP